MSLRRRVTLLTGVLATGALMLTGCASNSEGGGQPTGSITAPPSSTAPAGGASQSSSGPALASLVPAKIKQAGHLVVGVNVPYSPNEFLQGGKIIGFDVDLLDQTAKVLGLKTVYRQADFDKIVPAVQAGTYDIGMSSFTDNLERQKTVDFVDYFSAGILWAAQKGKSVNPKQACGLTVAVESNTTEEQDELPALNRACKKAGKQAIKVLSYESQDDATNAVVLGRANAMSADSPVTSYAIKQSAGKLVPAGAIKDSAPYGWPIKKHSTLVQAMQKALQTLIANGVYDQVCKKWGVQAGEIKKATVNGGTS